MLTECVYSCEYHGSIILPEYVYIIVVIEYTVELETFEDENTHEFHSLPESTKVLTVKFKGHGLAWHDNLLGVAQCTTHRVRQAGHFEHQ